MQPPIFIAGHDEQLGLAGASLPATMAKPTATQAARYRSEVRLFVEALGAGALDEEMVPEIETAFAELGRMAGLDFEQVRRGLGSTAKKAVLPDEHLARLPDVFTWEDVARVWGVKKRGAAWRLRKLLAENLIAPVSDRRGDGRYRVQGGPSAIATPKVASATAASTRGRKFVTTF